MSRRNPNNSSTMNNCQACDLPDNDQMTQCRQCNTWWHYICAGIDASVSERDFYCPKCTRSPTSGVITVDKSASTIGHSSTSSSRARARLNLQKLEARKSLLEKQLDLDRRDQERRHEQEKIQKEAEIERQKLQLDKEFMDEKFRILEEELDEEENDKRSSKSQQSSFSRVQQWRGHHPLYAATSSSKRVPDTEIAHEPVTVSRLASAIANVEVENIIVEKANMSANEVNVKPREEKISAPHNPGEHSRCRLSTRTREVQLHIPVSNEHHRQTAPSDRSHSPFLEAQATNELFDLRSRMANTTIDGRQTRESEMPRSSRATSRLAPLEQTRRETNNHFDQRVELPLDVPLTSHQLAARQVMPRELPVFSGNPEDWPLFISSYQNSTRTCGYTDAENLVRLQRCLKGHALDVVRSRLLLPAAVPHVISTLQTLYGRPELIIHTLMQKVRNVAPPKADKLESLIGFGLAVQNLHDHLEMADQEAHLNNPTLLFELVEKLPANLKLDWALYKKRHSGTNLTTFARYMSTMVSAASEVTLHFDPRHHGRSGKPEKAETRSFFGAHSSTGQNEGENDISYSKPEKRTDVSLIRNSSASCLVCKNPNHKVKECDMFVKMTLDERWKSVTRHGLCRSCLGSHGRRPCKLKRVCGVENCQFKHHPLLHNKRTMVTPQPESEGVVGHHYMRSSTLFKIIPIILHGNNRSITVFAFLDDGSSMTLVEQNVVEMLGIEGESSPLCLQWTANVTRTETDSKRVALNLSAITGKQKYNVPDVRTVNRLNLPKQSMCSSELAKLYPHLRGLPISDYEEAVPQILIGNDYPHLGAALKIREGEQQEPIAVKTRLGWTVYGVTQQQRSSVAHSFHICECGGYQALQDQMKQYFSIENLGVMEIVGPESNEDKRANEILQKTTKRIGERYETGLLWKYDHIEFPDSFTMAVKRLLCLEKRMKRNKNIEASVRRQMSEYEQKGYIHKATPQELKEADPRRTWYLPLGVVLNPKKPDKVRIFCDAAAKIDGKSLNSMLLKGPDFLSSLPAILFGFRERKIGFCADIQEMYHQLKIRKEDRNAQRILWREAPSKEPEIYIMDVATFGATSSPSSAQYVKNLNAREHSNDYPRAAEAIITKHYVDDYLDSKDSVEEATQLAKEVKFVHSRGGFHIRNWLSNSLEVVRQLGETDVSTEKNLILAKADSVERVLGIAWRPDSDVFIYSTTTAMDVAHPTKRQVLRAAMSLFDPLGFLSCFLIQGKILVQDLWRSNIEWDQLIPEKLREKWLQWTTQFKKLHHVSIPRHYFYGHHTREIESIELHIFVDASEAAYACVAYFRATCAGKIQCALVAAKSKVAPLKCISIPRLELQAAVLGVRLQKTIMASHGLPINKRVFWSDSRTVLAWINSDHRKYRQFVACRVGEILTKSNAEDWRWLPTKENVADEATRWKVDLNFSPESRWFRGPEFLHQPEDRWLVNEKSSATTNEEIKTCTFHQEKTVHQIINWDRFSKWTRLQRAIAYVYRYVLNLKRKVKRSVSVTGPLEQEEFTKAERQIWRWIQSEAYGDDFRRISVNHSKRRAMLESNSKLYKLSPFIDEEGLIRAESRLIAANFISFDVKCPIVLPRDHYAIRLLIEWYHQKYLHRNNETIVNEVRQRFHISSIRVVVRQVAKRCPLCKIKRAVPVIPRMAPLPAARLNVFDRPFSCVGVDFFGPLSIRVGRSCVKRWVALFTCLTIRAVHVEVVHSLSTESCKMAFRRFICRRGSPREIYSDNGTNFVGLSNELQREMSARNQQLAETFTNADTKWLFNPPAAPHMGGAWERLVRSIKIALFSMYTTRNPDEETFATLLAEAESVVNSRPLTFVALETDQQEALTPNHFLLLSSSGVVQPPKTLLQMNVATRTQWNLCRVMTDQFWSRWIREYLPTIARRTKWFGEVEPIQPGDLVVVVDDNKRNGWIRGRVTEVVKGKDGRSRQATVQTSNGYMRRPIAKVAKLDVDDSKTRNDFANRSYGQENVAESNIPSASPSIN